SEMSSHKRARRRSNPISYQSVLATLPHSQLLRPFHSPHPPPPQPSSSSTSASNADLQSTASSSSSSSSAVVTVGDVAENIVLGSEWFISQLRFIEELLRMTGRHSFDECTAEMEQRIAPAIALEHQSLFGDSVVLDVRDLNHL